MIEAIKYGVIFAFLVEGIHFLTTIYLTKNVKFKNKVLDKFKPLLFFFIILFILYIIFSGFSIVHTNENVVLTKINGAKLIIDDVGIHYSFLGGTTNYYLGKEQIEYPTFGQTGDLSNLYGEEELVTKDGKVIKHSAVLYYEITDLNKFAIKSKDTKIKLFYYLGSSITNAISTNSYERLMQDREIIEKEILNSFKTFEETYGVQVLDFKFLRITDSIVTISAKAEAEAEKIKSESLIKSYESEAEALRKKYNSIDDKGFIKYMELIKAIKEGKINTIVVPENSGIIINSG